MLQLVDGQKFLKQTHSVFKTENLTKKINTFKQKINNPEYGFFHLSDQPDNLNAPKELYKTFSYKKTFVQVGIGGSSLGPQMLVDVLGSGDCDFIFLDNIEADYIDKQLSRITNVRETLFYIVSKSGNTAETNALYIILRNWLLKNEIDENEFQNYFVFCTDPTQGDLRQHIIKDNLYSLPIPSNIGGRFSVLTNVGLFPALFAGIDIEKLFEGANNVKESLITDSINSNILIQTASQIAYSFFENKIDNTVLMPYSSRLKSFSQWFVQLWAESLGKFKINTEESTGLTPIAAYGATDQHSQMQLFMQGPKNKLILFIENLSQNKDFSLENKLGLGTCQELSTHTLNSLLKAELYGTLDAMKKANREYLHFQISSINAKSLAGLILFFESLTVLMGEYLEVDPFDQPGVEAAKVNTINILSQSK